MAREFGGDAAAMRRAAVAQLARQIHVDQRKLSAREQAAFADFAMVLSLVPELEHWPSDDKSALHAIIAAKAGRTEQRYMQLLQKHARLRAAMLRLGSRSV
jgi:uncharacterized protein YceH (UPF0502 family)